MANTNSLFLVRASSQYASVADTVPLSITGTITIEAWIYLASLPSANAANMQILSKGDLNNQRSFLFYIDGTSDHLRIQTTGDGTAGNTSLWETSSAILTSGELSTWIHVAVTLTPSTKTAVFYKNGSSVTSSQTTDNGATTIFNSTKPFFVGTRTSSDTAGEFYDGRIDEVRIWNVIRIASDISVFRSMELTGSETGLVGYWRFNNDYLDTTANAATLTASGSPAFSVLVPFAGISGFFILAEQ